MASKSNTAAARKADLVATEEEEATASAADTSATTTAAAATTKGKGGPRKGSNKGPSLTWDKEGARDLAFIQAMLQVAAGGPIADIDKVIQLVKADPAFAGSESLITAQKLRQRHGKLTEKELNFDLPALSGKRSNEPNAEFLNAAIAAMFKKQESVPVGGGTTSGEGTASMGVGGLVEE